MKSLKLSLAVAALGCLGGTSHGQSYFRSYGFDSGYVQLKDVECLPYGDIVSVSAGYTNDFVMRCDAAGNPRWSSMYFDPATPYADRIHDLAIDADGQLIACGFTGDHPWIAKIDSEVGGSPVWERSLSMDGSFHSATTLTNGDIVCAGEYHSARGDTDVLVVRFDRNGNVIWRRALGTFDRLVDDLAYCIIASRTGGFVVAGSTDRTVSDSDLLVMKIDDDGFAEWSRSIGAGWDEARSGARLVENDDGHFFVAATREEIGINNEDMWCLKLNRIGSTLWSDSYDWGEEQSHDVRATSDGGCVIVGDVLPVGDIRRETALIKLLSNGDIDWQRTYGGSDNESGARVVAHSEDGYLVAGSTQSFVSSSMAPMLVSVDDSGNLPGTSPYVGLPNFDVGSASTTNTPGPVQFQILNSPASPTITEVSPAAPDLDVRAMSDDDSWHDLGYGIAGAAGIPELYGFGNLSGGETIGIHLQAGRPDAFNALVIGFDVANLPFRGSTLVPNPAALLSLPRPDEDGVTSFYATWPSDMDLFEIYFQMIFRDSDAGGFSMSNAIHGFAP